MVVLKPLLLVFKFPIYLMIYCGSFRFNLFKPKNFSAHFFFQLSTYFFTSFLASNPFFPLSLSLSLSLSPILSPTSTIHTTNDHHPCHGCRQQRGGSSSFPTLPLPLPLHPSSPHQGFETRTVHWTVKGRGSRFLRLNRGWTRVEPRWHHN